MDSHLSITLNRIQEIEARMSAFAPPAAPPLSSPSSPPSGIASGVGAVPVGSMPGSGTGPARPFDVLLAQAGGQVQLRPIVGAAGPFPAEIESLVTRYAGQNNLDPALVRAVIQQESDGNPRCQSAVGAKGLMQLMPDTAHGLGVTDAFDPEQNIAAGTRYLSSLLREFKGDVPLALAAYNAGPGKVRQYGGIPPFQETQQYVQRIIKMTGK